MLNIVNIDAARIKKLANLVFDLSHLETEGFRRVDSMVKVLQSLGIEVYESGMKDLRISGYVTKSPNSGYPMIVVNSEEHIVRQRFTMAHELGHLLLHFNWKPHEELADDQTYNVAYRKHVEEYTDSQNIEETEANLFAAELLMPENEFMSAIADGMNDYEIAKVFGVSKPAAYIRRKELTMRAQGLN